MSKGLKTTLIVLGMLVGVAVLVGGGFLLGRTVLSQWGTNRPAMMFNDGGSAFRGRLDGRSSLGMMGIRGNLPFHGFGIFGGLLMLLLPVGLISLAVIGVMALLHRSGNPFSSAHMLACSHCKEPIQADWKVCPHCGTKIKK